MDLEGLRSMGVDYAILDKESSESYRLYEDICLGGETKASTVKSVKDPEEKRLLKLEINRIRMAERRANETDEERSLRLYKNKMRNKIRRATETPEQRSARNRSNMERNRQRRIKQREQHPDAERLSIATNESGSSYYINDLVRAELSATPPTMHDIAPKDYENR